MSTKVYWGWSQFKSHQMLIFSCLLFLALCPASSQRPLQVSHSDSLILKLFWDFKFKHQQRDTIKFPWQGSFWVLSSVTHWVTTQIWKCEVKCHKLKSGPNYYYLCSCGHSPASLNLWPIKQVLDCWFLPLKVIGRSLRSLCVYQWERWQLGSKKKTWYLSSRNAILTYETTEWFGFCLFSIFPSPCWLGVLRLLSSYGFVFP